jgi:hypothetical protein
MHLNFNGFKKKNMSKYTEDEKSNSKIKNIIRILHGLEAETFLLV